MEVMRAMTDPNPQAEYTAPAAEWAALLTLAAQPVPAQAIAAGEWQRAYFASPGAADAFAQLETAGVPVLLRVPVSLDGLALAKDANALDALRHELAGWAQTRALDGLAFNLRRELRRSESEHVPVGAELLAAARSALEGVAALDGSRTGASAETTIATLGELAAGYWQRIGEQRDAAPTGLGGLDRALGGGMQPGRLVVLLGAPGSGKTTLANQIAEHMADSGRPVFYLTTEDSPAALLAKTLARLGDLDYGAVLQGRTALREKIGAALLAVAARRSAVRLLYLEDAGRLTLDALKAMARVHFSRYDAVHAGESGGAGLLVVDYLQRWARGLRGVPGESRELRELVSWLTEGLRGVARELNCTVLALASQNRASGYNAGGTALASAKESGDIEYAGDVLMALGKDEKRSAGASFIKPWTLNIAKNRQGETRTLDLDWYPDRQQFTMAGEAGE